MNGKLVLANGAVFTGRLLTPTEATVGEVVFNTSMTGYQEVLTDPSYCGQIVTMTYPLLGNYGICRKFNESRASFVRGFVAGEVCDSPSNWRQEQDLAAFLRQRGVVCLYGVDTRAVTRAIRSAGVMKGVICSETMATSVAQTLAAAQPDVHDHVLKVTTRQVYRLPNDGPRVAVLDLGVKTNILRRLHQLGCDLTVVPAQTSAVEILAYQPDGIFLSNGPGDPKDVPRVVATVKKLIGRRPMFGICLGHQIIALALGGDTYKLKFGHRGCNHPVKDLRTGRVYITSQNHGYAVDEASLAGSGLAVTYRALNDGTVEGLAHRSLPLFSVQYHPEAAPGPGENAYLLEKFVRLMLDNRAKEGRPYAQTI